MKKKEILRLVWTNLVQNKFKVILTSVGIIIGAATIVMVIAIGRGGQLQVEEQFKNLNAGAIDISYELADSEKDSGNSQGFGGEMKPGGAPAGGTSGGAPMTENMPVQNNRPDMGNGGDNGQFKGGFSMGGANLSDRMNQEKITLSEEDMDNLQVFVPGLSSATISYTTKSMVEGGELEEETSYTIAGVKSNYAPLSNLSLQIGTFITDEEEENKEKICVLGASVAKELFGDAASAYDSSIAIDGRSYLINGVLEEVGSVSSGISPDEAMFLPYSTGIKYITGQDVSATITVIAEDLNDVDGVIANIETVLADSYPSAEFIIADAGSKMEAASASNHTLTTLLFAMAFIVFVVGGIGIMNVLFVSVKERTKEIGILKAIGCTQKDILMEFLLEACLISIFGGIVGVAISFLITPVASWMNIPAAHSVGGVLIALVFAIVTGTVFGFYPAWKASRLVPVDALREE